MIKIDCPGMKLSVLSCSIEFGDGPLPDVDKFMDPCQYCGGANVSVVTRKRTPHNGEPATRYPGLWHKCGDCRASWPHHSTSTD